MAANENGQRARERILAYVIGYKQQHTGKAPTMRDIMTGCDIRSTSVVSFHLRKLAETGLVTLDNGYIGLPGEVYKPPKWWKPGLSIRNMLKKSEKLFDGRVSAEGGER